jgi:hypothetical protein
VDLRQAQPRHASHGDRAAKESSGLHLIHRPLRFAVLPPSMTVPPTIARPAIV